MRRYHTIATPGKTEQIGYPSTSDHRPQTPRWRISYPTQTAASLSAYYKAALDPLIMSACELPTSMSYWRMPSTDGLLKTGNPLELLLSLVKYDPLYCRDTTFPLQMVGVILEEKQCTNN